MRTNVRTSVRTGLAWATAAFFASGFDLLQSPNRAVEEGNAGLKAGKAEEALKHYDRAVRQLPADTGVHFNRGAALFALSRFDEAAGEFLRATEAKAVPLKPAAFYNLGNSFFVAEKYDDAVAAYRRTLTFDPTHAHAKWNLELALKKRKEKEEQKKQEDKQDKQDKKDDQQKPDEQQKPQQEREKDKKKEQDKGKDEKDKDKPPDKDEKPEQKAQEQQKEQKQSGRPQSGQEPPPPPSPSDKAPELKELDAVLDSLERSPKDLEKERARLRAVRRALPVKDW